MLFIYLLIGIAFLIVWIYPTALVILFIIGIAFLTAWTYPAVFFIISVIGIVGLVVYVLKDGNKAALKPSVDQNDLMDSKPLVYVNSMESENKSNKNIIESTGNNLLVEIERNLVSDENRINKDVVNVEVLSVPELCKSDRTPNIIVNTTNDNNTTMPTDEKILYQGTYKNDRRDKMSVPVWTDTYIASIKDLYSGTTSQQSFYRYYKEQFLKGNYIDIDGNTNYAFLLMYDLGETYCDKISLLKEYYQYLIEICPKVELCTQRILKNIIVDDKKQKIKKQLSKYADNQQESCRWISKGEDIEIGGVKLCRGGFYVGNCFKLPKKVIENNKYRYDCGYIYGPVINPKLPINNDEIENECFCSYQDMTPQQRYAYLQWLSGNNPIEKTCVDLIQYYLYGLEIRLFIDKIGAKERKQILIQLSELYKQLKKIGKNVNDDYCQLKYTIIRIISVCIEKYYPLSAGDFLPEDELMSCHDYMNYVINQELREKTELTPEDAYRVAKKTYLLKDLPISLYDNNIKDKFISLFQKRFKKLSIAQLSDCYIRNTYYIGSHNEGELYCPEDVNFEIWLPRLPIDGWMVRNSINEIVIKLQEDFYLYNSCVEWTSYSAPLALLQLPKYIELDKRNKINVLKKYLYSILDNSEYYLIDVDSLLKKMGYIRKGEKSLYLKTILAITNGLKKLKLRIAPLVDVDNKRLNFGDKCVIYKIKGVSKVERTDTYSRLELFVKLVVLLIQVDICDENDIIFVDSYIDSQSDTSGNTRHLKAYFRWLQRKKLLLDKKTKDSVSKLLNKEQCKQFAYLLVKLSCNQGDINNKRVDILTKIFPLLGEDANNIHAQIHRMLIDRENFATVEITTDAKEYVISQAQSKFKRRQKMIKIDTAKLSKLEAQTLSAQNILSEIFNEEEIVTSAITTDSSPLIVILEKLLTKPEWSKAEVDNICKEFNAITGSILEQINDYAYDKVDDVVIEEDDDIIFVNTDYKDKLI